MASLRLDCRYRSPFLGVVDPVVQGRHEAVERVLGVARVVLEVPKTPVGKFGRYADTMAEPGKKHTYRVIAVNTVGLKSMPSADSLTANAR
jgi:hypothetical protein